MSNEIINPERKLTSGVIMGNIERLVDENVEKEGDELPLYKIGGVVSYAEYSKGYDGSQSIDSWVRFHGEFYAVNLLNNKQFTSNKAFLQEPFQSMITSELEKGLKDIEFAFTVIVEKSKKSKVGYIFKCSSLKPLAVSDRLIALKALIQSEEPLKITDNTDSTKKLETDKKKGTKN